MLTVILELISSCDEISMLFVRKWDSAAFLASTMWNAIGIALKFYDVNLQIRLTDPVVIAR